MRGAVLAAVALLACRGRTRRPPEPDDVVVVSDRVTPNDRRDVVIEDAAAQGDASFEGGPVWDVRARCGVELQPMGGGPVRRGGARAYGITVAPGAGFDALWRSVGEDCPPEAWIEGIDGARVRLRSEWRHRVVRSRDPSVAFALAWGHVSFDVSVGSPSPLRVDTSIGRIIVTEGRVDVRVIEPRLPGTTDRAVIVQTLGGTATLWLEGGGAAVSIALPRRGTRMLRPAGDALTVATRELSLARSLLVAGAPEAAVMRAGLALGRAEAALWERSTPALRSELDALARLREAVAP